MANSNDLVALFKKLQSETETLSELEKDASGVFRETLDVILDNVFSNEEFMRLYSILNEVENKPGFNSLGNGYIIEEYEETDDYQSLSMATTGIFGFMVLKYKQDNGIELYCSIPQENRHIPDQKSFANEEENPLYDGQWVPYCKITRDDLCKARNVNKPALFVDFYKGLKDATGRAIDVLKTKKRIYTSTPSSDGLSETYTTRLTRLQEFAQTLSE